MNYLSLQASACNALVVGCGNPSNRPAAALLISFPAGAGNEAGQEF
ncbi:MAG: hypothetical protein DSM106950_13850 [Stigonema ocellatum SAG 48.90 = DSM 106950]|nr:hypothetical protein [Stigonema ocellatum SAG 48.90 = DSM 106950]